MSAIAERAGREGRTQFDAGTDIGTVEVILMVTGTVALVVGLTLSVSGRGSADQSI